MELSTNDFPSLFQHLEIYLTVMGTRQERNGQPKKTKRKFQTQQKKIFPQIQKSQKKIFFSLTKPARQIHMLDNQNEGFA